VPTLTSIHFLLRTVEWVLGQRKLIEEGLEKAVQAAGLEEDPNAPAHATIIDERMAAIIDADGDGVVSAAEAAEIAGKQYNYTQKYLRALSGPLLVFLIGLGLGLGVLRLSLIDSICVPHWGPNP